MEFLRKLEQIQERQANTNPPDKRGSEATPFLWELMTVSRYADGSERIPSTVKVCKGIGCWSVTLQDDEMGLQVKVDSPTLAEVWQALERALLNAETKWLPFKSFKKKPGKKKPPEKKA